MTSLMNERFAEVMSKVYADITDNLTDDGLAHFGIKGMKWGVRRREGPDGTVANGPDAAGPDTRSEDAKVADAARVKPISQLSNQELQILISRMNLEQQYSKLTAAPPPPKDPPPGPPSKAQKLAGFAQSLAVKVGAAQADRVVGRYADVFVEDLLSKSSNKAFREVADRLAPKKKGKAGSSGQDSKDDDDD